MTELNTYDQIVHAADNLFYRRGYEYTSFSDIAQAVDISRGNFYYHFKSKDDILRAVIDLRLARTRRMLKQWEAETDQPRERIRKFIQILHHNRTHIKRSGCPVGSLCSELSKLGHGSKGSANRILTLFRTWLRRQFKLMGCGAEADELALHVLAHSQGVAVLANAFGDEKLIKQEVGRISRWLDSFPRS